MRGLLIIGLLMCMVTACKKAEDRRCLKGAGEEQEKEVIVDPFNQLYIGPHVNVVLVQDTVEKVVIRGGKNLISFVDTKVVDDVLSIENKNKCNFLRSYKKQLHVEVHLKNIIRLHFEGTKPLNCEGQLNLPWLNVFIRDGAGQVNLNLNSNWLNTVVTHGWGNFVLEGSTNYLRLEVGSNGFGDAYGLTVQDSIHVISKTPETIRINADNNKLRAENSASGDIWYQGTPLSIDHQRHGTGDLLNKN